MSGDHPRSRPYDPGVIPIILAIAGVLALVIAAAILRTFGAGYRVGRLLAVAPRVTVAEAIRIAEAGETAYVRIDGRIDSDADFEDEHHRPLVLRRTTQRTRPASGRGSWTTIDVSTEQADFVVREGLEEIGVATADLAEGLVVVPRERRGRAGDLGEGAPAGVPAEAELTITIEQVSTVEHATVAGVPRRAPDGHVVMGSGMGRPLLLTTLERDEAMRVLTGGATSRAKVAIACLIAAVVFLGGATIWLFLDMVLGGGVATAFAASPDPTLRPGGDTRTPGANPGFVGQPVFAILGVLALGIGSVVATLAYVRLSGVRGAADEAGRRRR
jgi:hypothetical protein